MNPANVDTPMIINPVMYKHFRPDLQNPTDEDVLPTFRSMNLLDRPMLDPVEISNAILYLASEDARSITGVCLPVDLGLLTK